MGWNRDQYNKNRCGRHEAPHPCFDPLSGIKKNIAFLNENVDQLQGAVRDNSEEIENKVDKEAGKGLSTNDFTNADKEKLNNTPAVVTPDAEAKEGQAADAKATFEALEEKIGTDKLSPPDAAARQYDVADAKSTYEALEGKADKATGGYYFSSSAGGFCLNISQNEPSSFDMLNEYGETENGAIFPSARDLIGRTCIIESIFSEPNKLVTYMDKDGNPQLIYVIDWANHISLWEGSVDLSMWSTSDGGGQWSDFFEVWAGADGLADTYEAGVTPPILVISCKGAYRWD